MDDNYFSLDENLAPVDDDYCECNKIEANLDDGDDAVALDVKYLALAKLDNGDYTADAVAVDV